jgi:hypothetical protein
MLSLVAFQWFCGQLGGSRLLPLAPVICWDLAQWGCSFLTWHLLGTLTVTVMFSLASKHKGPGVSKIRNARGEITMNTMEVQEIIRDYFENLYSNKFENLEEMDRFLDTYYHPKLNQENINNLNRPITQNEIEAAI